jgi:hypothetical protein
MRHHRQPVEAIVGTPASLDRNMTFLKIRECDPSVKRTELSFHDAWAASSL